MLDQLTSWALLVTTESAIIFEFTWSSFFMLRSLAAFGSFHSLLTGKYFAQTLRFYANDVQVIDYLKGKLIVVDELLHV